MAVSPCSISWFPCRCPGMFRSVDHGLLCEKYKPAGTSKEEVRQDGFQDKMVSFQHLPGSFSRPKVVSAPGLIVCTYQSQMRYEQEFAAKKVKFI